MKLKQTVKPGALLLKEEPFVYILSSKLRTQHCDNCFKQGDLLKCSACQYVYYCGKVCQKDGWNFHKFECKNFKRIAPQVLPDSCRLLVRIVRKLQHGGEQFRGYYTESNFRMFKDLMSHYPDLKVDEERIDHFNTLCTLINIFLDEIKVPNKVELMGMYGRMCVNSFTIYNQEMQTQGTGIYLGASILDHSCDSNVVATFVGSTIYIRTTKEIPDFEWSKAFLSYIDILNTPKNRQKELEKCYYFLCQCDPCVNLKHFSLMTSAACPKKDCKGYVDINKCELHCNLCNTSVESDFLEKFYEVKQFTEMQMKNMKEITYLDVCKMCLNKQKNVFHKFNYLHVKALDLAFESSIEMGSFDDALTFGFELVEGFRLYYGDMHPLLGLLHLKLGKILLFKNDPRKSQQHIQEAHKILKITHGETSPIIRNELKPLLGQANEEVNSLK